MDRQRVKEKMRGWESEERAGRHWREGGRDRGWKYREIDVCRLTTNANLKHEQFIKGDLSWERFQTLPAQILSFFF